MSDQNSQSQDEYARQQAAYEQELKDYQEKLAAYNAYQAQQGQPTVPEASAAVPAPATTPQPSPQQSPYAMAGAASPQPGYAPGAAASPYAQAPRRSHKKLIIILVSSIGGFLLLCAIGVVLLFTVRLHATSAPKNAATEYLQDLSAGKASAALKLTAADGTGANSPLLSDAVLKGASARITNIAVGSVDVENSEAAVDATWDLAGKHYSKTLVLQKDSEGWKVSSGLVGTLPFTTSDYGYSITGAKALSSDDIDYVFAGVYTAVAPSDLLSVSGDASIVVTGAAGGSTDKVGFTVAPNDKYLASIQTQVDSYLDACVKKTSWDAIEGCGIDLPYPENVDEDTATVAAKIVSYPKIALSGSSDDFESFKLSDAGKVTAKVSGDTWDGTPGTESLTGNVDELYFTTQYKDGKVAVDFGE